MTQSRRSAKRLAAIILAKALFVFLTSGLADNQAATFVVTQDQAPLTFYQDGKITGVEALAKGTSIRAESVSGDMVLTTYKGKAAYIPLKFLAAQESVLVVAGDDCELFYYNDAGPTGLERLPKGTQVTVAKRSLDQVFTTYKGKTAYIKSQFLITPQEFNSVVEKEAAAKREKAERALAEAQEKAEAALVEKMERDIKQVRARVLNPKNSSVVSYYDQVINNELREFLVNYPSSPYRAEVNDQIKEWQTERDRVAAGMAKYNGDWVTKANFDKYYRWDQVLALYRDGDRFITQTNWSAAVQKFDAVLALNQGGGTEIATRRQLAVALTRWLTGLSHDLQISGDRLTTARNALQQAQATFKQAQANLKKPAAGRSAPRFTGVHAGTSAAAMRTMEVANSTQIELEAAQTRLDATQIAFDAAQAENDKIKRATDQVRKRLAQADSGIAQPDTTAEDKAAAVQTSTESPDVITMIQIWFKQYWVVAVGVGLLSLFILTRLLR